MNVGVIGAGWVGAIHARLLAGAGLVAVADLERSRAAAYGVAAYADGLELVADPRVEAVVVATPVATHEPLVLACLEAGKPVLCEKPLASAAASLRIADADVNGRVTVGFMRRFDPGYVDLKARLGEIGAPLLIHCAHRNPRVSPDFDSEKILTDSVVHEIDVARWLLREDIVRVTVHAPRPTSEAPPGVRDPLLIVFETASGVLVDVEAFVNARFGYDIRCEVVGEAGTLELLAPVAAVARRSVLGLARELPQSFGERFAAAFRAELRAWLNALERGEEPPGATAWDGYAAARVAEAAVEAFRTGRPVEVSRAV